MNFRSWGSRYWAIAMLLTFTAFNCFASSDYYFKVSDVFGIQSPYDTNRIFKIQSLSPFAGQFFYRTSSVAGDFWVSNAISFTTIGNTYQGQLLAPPSSLTFSFFVPNTNMGTVLGQNWTALPANSVNSFPAGATAPSWQAALQTFALGTNGPAAGINANQASNITISLISSSNANYTSIVYSNSSMFVATSSVPSITNGYVRSDITNGLASVTLLNTTSNLLQIQIGASGISAITATNISTNQVFLATNGIRVATGLSAFAPTNQFDAAGAGVTAATAATNAAAIGSGLSAYVSTNRFDVSGAATAAATASTNVVAGWLATSNANYLSLIAVKANTNSPTIWTAELINPDISTELTFNNGDLTLTEDGNGAFSSSSGISSFGDITIPSGNGSFVISGTGQFIGNGVSITNVPSTGISTNGSTANQTLGSVGGRTVWTNASELLGTSYTNGFVRSSITNGLASITSVNTTSNSLQSQITAGGINAVTGTNIANFQIGLSNASLIASNALLFVAKVDKTNGFSTGQQATNLATLGSLSFGQSGQATNIIGGTNVIKFINSGSSLATNASFKWMGALNLYTNWLNGGIYTNNGSAWLMITNGVTLYSLSGTSPIGQMSAVSGALPAPLAVSSFEFDHNGMADVGFFSITNFNTISNGIVTNVITISSNSAIANFGGFGTNTFLTNSILSWNVPVSLNLANNGGTMNFQAMSAGLANTNFGSGYGAAVLSGATNRLGLSGASVIAGGEWNNIGGSFNNFCFIGGGISNSMGSIDGAVIGGGFMNTGAAYYSVIGGGWKNSATGLGSIITGGMSNTNQGTGGAILAGTNNFNSGNYSIVFGRAGRVTNNIAVQWSDGQSVAGPTNSQFNIAGTNGLLMNGPIIFSSSAITNSGIYYYSNSASFSLFGVTNNMPNFAYWKGVSNGVLVTIFYSNGLPVMRNDWP